VSHHWIEHDIERRCCVVIMCLLKIFVFGSETAQLPHEFKILWWMMNAKLFTNCLWKRLLDNVELKKKKEKREKLVVHRVKCVVLHLLWWRRKDWGGCMATDAWLWYIWT